MEDQKEAKIEVTPVPVGDIRIQMGNDAILFSPEDDMTAKESALIMQMFFNGFAHRDSASVIDFGGFIAKHNLQRHFKAIQDQE